MTLAPSKNRALDLFLATDQVVGQEIARKRMSLVISRQQQVAEGRWPHSRNALVLGPSGSGKTMCSKLMCAASGLPFAEVNATEYTESGYAGKSLSQALVPLLEAAADMYDEAHPEQESDAPSALKREPEQLAEIVALAETGVVLVDEFDKWLQRQNHTTGRMDTAIQTEFLKILEGTVEWVADNEDEMGVPVDTSRILFLCAGAFVELPFRTAKRLEMTYDRDSVRSKNPFLKDAAFWEKIVPEDFIAMGMLPELAGRLPTHIFFKGLETSELAQILTLPGGIVEEYRQRFEEYGVAWDVDSAGIAHLAEQAQQGQIGVRGLEHEMAVHFSAALYQAAVVEAPMKVSFKVNSDQATLVPA